MRKYDKYSLSSSALLAEDYRRIRTNSRAPTPAFSPSLLRAAYSHFPCSYSEILRLRLPYLVAGPVLCLPEPPGPRRPQLGRGPAPTASPPGPQASRGHAHVRSRWRAGPGPAGASRRRPRPQRRRLGTRWVLRSHRFEGLSGGTEWSALRDLRQHVRTTGDRTKENEFTHVPCKNSVYKFSSYSSLFLRAGSSMSVTAAYCTEQGIPEQCCLLPSPPSFSPPRFLFLSFTIIKKSLSVGTMCKFTTRTFPTIIIVPWDLVVHEVIHQKEFTVGLSLCTGSQQQARKDTKKVPLAGHCTLLTSFRYNLVNVRYHRNWCESHILNKYLWVSSISLNRNLKMITF